MAKRRTKRRARSGDTKPPKLAEGLAQKIERSIVSRKWPVGTVLGSEEELLARFGVSRAVLREAVRILEHHQTATMRRGPGGGLVVTHPDSSAVVRAAALVLDFEKATAAQLSDARLVIELAATERAAQRIDEAGIEKLRASLAREADLIAAGMPPEVILHDLHVLISELSGNPVLPLFVRVLTKVMEQHYVVRKPPKKDLPSMLQRTHRSHEKIVDAIVRGDIGLARHRMQRDLEAILPYLC